MKSTVRGYDAVVHLAAKVTTPFTNTDIHSFEQVNHWGTAELVYSLDSDKLPAFIYLSSCSVYGFTHEDVDRKSLPNPQTAYAHSKLNGERQVMRLVRTGKSRAYILRSGNVYGFSPSMRFDAVINRLMFDAKFNGKIYIEGTGQQSRPFIYIKNLIKTLISVLFDEELESGVYNVFDENRSVLEIMECIKGIYPDVDVQYLSQHVVRGGLKFKAENYLHNRYGKPETCVEENIRMLSSHFAL